jgi:glutamate-1-semialdehyde aminotransferase
MSAEVADARIRTCDSLPTTDVGGIGGTLSGNALSLAAMRATLEHVLTDEAFERMIALGERWADGVSARSTPRAAVGGAAARVPRGVLVHAGRRRGPVATPRPRTTTSSRGSRTCTRSTAASCSTPFHNMALMSPATTEADVDAHSAVFDEMATELTA